MSPRQTYLIRQHVSTEIAQRQLELLQAVVDGDLDRDERVRRSGVSVGSHRGLVAGRESSI